MWQRLQCFCQSGVDPRRYITARYGQWAVLQASLRMHRPRFRDVQTIRQFAAAEHLIGDDGERKQVGMRAGITVAEILRRHILNGARKRIFRRRLMRFCQTGNLHGAKINDFYATVSINHNIVGL